MKKTLALIALSLFAFAGCRREDIREMTVTFAELNDANKPQIVAALAKYSGIDQGSYRWDYKAKTLTLTYDSMKIAQSNIRYAIDEKGIKVVFPAKTDNRAGH